MENRMNDKKKFYYMLLNHNIVTQRYYQLTHPISYDKKDERRPFSEVINESIHKVRHEVWCSGRDKNGYKYDYPTYHFDDGKAGWKERGIFSFIPLYKNSIWTKDIVVKYKARINPRLLLIHGDFDFSEELLYYFESKLSFKDIPVNPMWPKTVSVFDKKELLSHEFIIHSLGKNYKLSLFKKALFVLDKELFNKIYKYYIDIYGTNKKDEIEVNLAEIIEAISCNNRINITIDFIRYISKKSFVTNWQLLLPKTNFSPDDLWEFFLIKPNIFDIFLNCDFSLKKCFIPMLLKDTRLNSSIENSYIRNFYNKGQNVLDQSNKHACINELKKFDSFDFSIATIKKNKNDWDKVVEVVFDRMNRRPDTNYYYYKSITAWNILSKEKTILLTHELCKYLMSIEVEIGDEEVREDGWYSPEYIGTKKINALRLFQYRNILDDEEMDKIINDESLMNFFFSNIEYEFGTRPLSNPVIDKAILDFFKDFKFENYRELLSISN